MITASNFISDITDHLPNFVIIDFDVKKSFERPLVRVFNKKNITKFSLNIQNDINTCINSINNINVNERYCLFNQ